MLSKLATRIDSWGAGKKMVAFREGWPAKTRDDIKFFDTGTTQFRYRERGEGQTLVFCADPPVTLELYDEVLDLFADHFRAIVLELGGMGFSVARSSYTYGFDETCDEVADFCEAVAGLGAVLGFSCAAGLAGAAIAVRRPDLVAKLILIQTAGWEEFKSWKAARDPKGILRKPFAGQLAMRRVGYDRAPDWINLAAGREERKEPFSCCAQDAIKRGAGWSLASAYQRYLTDTPSPIGVAKQPTLCVWGKLDGSHGRAAPASSLTLAENARLAELDDVGHFPELEDPRQALELVKAFC